ncbi:RNA polymerase sigma factor [Albidovulum sediminis]|uniref:RNA polymerase sigma factor n=1 Tax=Albidovulum sediminis TaxID=3066345 RepID=A0ABT2NVD1_9RHOB|nr:RNA polymerase sigma factor [Defluviimonas sediminis]
MLNADQRRMLTTAGSRLFGYALALTRNRDQARDLVQDCVVRALSSAGGPENERSFRAWLFTIARNVWIDQLRSSRRQRALLGAIDEANNAAAARIDATVARLAVREAFFHLSPDHRDVLALVDIGGFSYDETAIMLGINRGTVMSRVSRARAALEVQLSDVNVVAFPGQDKGVRHG